MTVIAYFGCWNEVGHHLYSAAGIRVTDYEIRSLRLPSPQDLDASSLFLPPEFVGEGCITYLPAMNRTVLAWWGNNPWDSRPRTNNAIIVAGNASEDVTWKLFARYFPKLEPLLKRPALIEAFPLDG